MNQIRNDRIKALDAMTDYSELSYYFLEPMNISREHEYWEMVFYFAKKGKPIDMYRNDWNKLFQQLINNGE